jgi:hypothetical protein
MKGAFHSAVRNKHAVMTDQVIRVVLMIVVRAYMYLSTSGGAGCFQGCEPGALSGQNIRVLVSRLRVLIDHLN